MPDLSRSETEAVHRFGDVLVDRFSPKAYPSMTRKLGTVTSVSSDDARLSVLCDGDDVPMVGIPCTTACAGVGVDDRVIVELFRNAPIVTNIIAKSLDNPAYVSWTDLWRSGTKYVSYMCDGSSVWLAWDVNKDDTTYWVAGTLPEELWPEKPVWAAAVMASGSGYVRNNTAMCYVGVNGQAGFQQGAAVSGARNCGLASWPLRAADA